MTIKCPFCAEEIQAEAKKCKHCGEWLTITQETTQPTAAETGVKQPSRVSVGPAGQTIGNNSELHRQPWFTVLMLVFCFPIGLVLMWLYQTKWSVTVKSVITAAISVLLIISIATNGTPTDQPTPTASNPPPAKAAPTSFSKLTITNTSYSNGNVIVNGTTDTPNGTEIDGYLDVADRSGNETAIGDTEEATVSNGAYTITFSVPKRPEFAGGKLKAEIHCTAGSGQTYIGPLAHTDSWGNNMIERDLIFSVHHMAPSSYPMVTPASYEHNTPKWAFAEFLCEWQKQDWNRMVRYTDKTWLHDDNGQEAPAAAATTLSNYLDSEVILGSKITGESIVDPCHAVINSEIVYAIGRDIRRETMQTDVIQEDAAYSPSTSGQWGVEPDMRTTDK